MTSWVLLIGIPLLGQAEIRATEAMEALTEELSLWSG